ncbi:MAG TPA: hypothetical protein VNJ08_15255 [Bacteriovoracaceae bacterium]|nr:hypothetical protein [Bacteriovoracaceae bacterium]
MKLFILCLSLSITPLLQAADCHTTDIISGGTFNCDNLYVDTVLTIGTDPQPIIINVVGETIISANIMINGANGLTIANNADSPGGVGGPGAGLGGERNFGNPTDGINVVPLPPSASDGNAIVNVNGVCGNGGGGGGFGTAGVQGALCPGGSAVPAVGGSSVAPAEFDFTLALFRGGFGGGCGDERSPRDEVGSGGGGGGGIHINAGGNITINSGVTISARGGNGGQALLDAGGGGGGGSGGAVWLKTIGVITNSGTIDLRGGDGGIAVSLGHGGAGGDGSYMLESSTGTITGTGLRSPTLTTTPSIAAQNMTSSISCASVKMKNSDNFAQMTLGFALAALIASMLKILLRSRLKT